MFSRKALKSKIILLFLLLASHAVGQSRFDPKTVNEVGRQAILRGEIHEALTYFEAAARAAETEARTSASPTEYWRSASAAYYEAARAALLIGELQRAVILGEKGVEMADRAGVPVIQQNALRGLRSVYRTVRNHAKASELLKRQMDLLNRQEGLSKTLWEGIIYEQMAEDMIREKKNREAIDALNKSIALTQQVLDGFHLWRRSIIQLPLEFYRSRAIHLLDILGNAYFLAEDLELAAKQYRQALQDIEGWQLRYISEHRLHLGLGQIEFRRGDWSRALSHYQDGLALAERVGMFDGITIAAVHIAEAHAKAGHLDAAVRSYEKAISRIEQARSGLWTEEDRQTYFGGETGVYTGMIDALLRSAREAEAFDYSERSRARVFLDSLGSKLSLARASDSPDTDLTRLQRRMTALTAATAIVRGKEERERLKENLEEAEKSYADSLNAVRQRNPEQASLISVEPLSLKQVQELLEPQQALLQYLVAPQKLYLWVVTGQQVRAIEIPLSQKELVKKVQAFRAAISELRPLKEAQTIARELYGEIAAPAMSLIRGKELIVVPHDVLHYLLFQALYSPGGRYLVEDYSISYLSSASLMQFTKAKRRAVGQKVLAVGNPSFEASNVGLPMSELEASEIRRLYPQSTVMARADAKEEKVKALSPTHDVLHFATHAELNKNDPLSSAVLLAKGGGEDGRLEVREIFGMDLKASLVVLSGCETALGNLSQGDELVGLTRAFIYAGTPSVVASLWKVDDASTASLMSGFYKSLKSRTKVEALRQAQLEMIRGKVNTNLLAQRGVGGVAKLGQTPVRNSQGSISTSHPYFWAPFILVGEGK